jgi:hypothetical protein
MSTGTALKILFELLEDYAPVWYTEDHHNLAVDALSQTADCRPAETLFSGGQEPALPEC